MILHVDFDLVSSLRMADSEGGVDDDLGLVSVAAGAEQGADDAMLVWRAAGAMVENREEGLGRVLVDMSDLGSGGTCLWLYHDSKGAGCGLGANCGGTERSAQVEEGILFSHAG